MKNLNLKEKLFLLATLAYSAWVRLQDLGYSEYQGDEILTLNFRGYQGSFLQYILTRDKGPLQFIINFLTYQLTGTWEEWVIRLPYALAGIAFVYVIFEVTRRVPKNNWAGIFAAILTGTNGLFIAFSRITQYQAFVQLLLATVILLFINMDNTKNSANDTIRIFADWNWISADIFYVGLAGLIFGIAALAHYDALTFLAFTCFYFGKSLFKIQNLTCLPARQEFKITKGALKKAIAFFLPFITLTGAFYIPFFLNSTARDTSNYLQRRVLGGGFMPRTLYSKILMKFYMPKELIFALVILSCLSLYFILKPVIRNSLSVIRKPNERTRRSNLWNLFLLVTSYLLPVTFIFTFWFSTQWIKPRGSTLMFYTLTLFTLAVLFFAQSVDKIKASLFTWFLASSCFYLFFNKTPRTHVYIIFIPMFILSGYTISRIITLLDPFRSSRQVGRGETKIGKGKSSCDFSLKDSLEKGKKAISKNPLVTSAMNLGFAILFIYTITLSLTYNNKIFVEKTPEYIWGNKQVFGREMIEIDKNVANKVQGIFGFPHRRGWEKIADLYEKNCLVGSYSTNEKARIPAFYIPKEPVADQEQVFENTPDNIIIVKAPVSWCYENLDQTPNGYVELESHFIANQPVTKIFGKEELYPEGRLICK